MGKPLKRSGSTTALKKRPTDNAMKATIALAVALVLALVAFAVMTATGDRTPAPGPTPAAAKAPPIAPAPARAPDPAPVRPSPPKPRVEAAPAPAAETEPEPEPELEPEPKKPEYATAWARGRTEKVRVKRVVDGDTLECEGGKRVRLVGINTPEKDEPLYRDASATLRELVEGQEVTLEFDQETTDQYQRTLAYVFKGDLFVNGEVVRRGFAYCYTWEPNTAHESELLTFQKEARTARRGLWGQPPPAPESVYVADSRGHRFHRPSCKRADRIRGKRLEFATRDAALDAGQNPCNECRP